jgi:hypothetical protein
VTFGAVLPVPYTVCSSANILLCVLADTQYARHKQYHVFRLVFLLYLLLPTAFLIFEVSPCCCDVSKWCHVRMLY